MASTTETLTTTKAALLGMIHSDGHAMAGRGKGKDRKPRYFVRLGEPNLLVRNMFKNYVREIYGLKAIDKPYDGTIIAYGKEMLKDILSYGPLGSHRWRAPVHFLRKPQARRYLRSFFGGDGDVRVSPVLSKCKVRAKSVNREGLLSIKTLLEKYFDIEAKLYKHGRPKFPGWSQPYDLEVIGIRNLERFARWVGFDHPAKAERLAMIVERIRMKKLSLGKRP